MVDDFDESLYREKRRDGTIHLIDALARHTSPYLSKSGNYETLEGRLFPVVDITDYRALFADPGNRSHFRQFRLRPALHPERPPSDFSQAKSREEALRVAGPPWRFREAYYDAKAMFPDPDRH
ncbi:MAG TPA: hypothetical protein VG839_00340, partial [Asticcacaulis sp.]|nr:hypothetical protein [Asticcacaulis sp.]